MQIMSFMANSEQLLRLPQVKARVGLGKTAIYGAIKKGQFPRPVKVAGVAAVAWPASSIDQWIAQQIAPETSSRISVDLESHFSDIHIHMAKGPVELVVTH